MDNSLDQMIEKYSRELMSYVRKNGSPLSFTEEKHPDDNTEPDSPREESSSDTALFYARVSTGRSSYPVESARVAVYYGEELLHLLTTDESGETVQVSLKAPSEQASLQPQSQIKSLEYTADVFARGFIEKRGLPVSAVGGSRLLLNVELVPEGEAAEG